MLERSAIGNLILAANVAITLLTRRRGIQAQQLPPSLSRLARIRRGPFSMPWPARFGKVVSEGTSLQMTVQPYTGTSTFLPLLNSGEIDFGVNNSVDMALSYQGPERLKIGGRNPYAHTPNAAPGDARRAPAGGPPGAQGLPLKSVHDIKGKRRHRRVPGSARRLVQSRSATGHGGAYLEGCKSVAGAGGERRRRCLGPGTCGRDHACAQLRQG